jgi:hypothetical protein
MIVGGRSPHPASIKKWGELHLDALLAFVDQLIRTFPVKAYEHLLAYAQETEESAIIFNLIEVLREFDQFSNELEYEIAARCDEETLWELYQDVVEESLSDTSYWHGRLPSQIERFHEEIEIMNIKVEELQFSGGDAVSFNAVLQFDVKGTTDEDEYGYSSGRDTFTYAVTGYPKGSGVVIDDTKFLR